MRIFKWFVVSSENSFTSLDNLTAIGEDITEARRNVQDNMEALFQYCSVSPWDRAQIQAGNKEVFQQIADARQEFTGRILATISEEPHEIIGNGMAAID